MHEKKKGKPIPPSNLSKSKCWPNQEPEDLYNMDLNAGRNIDDHMASHHKNNPDYTIFCVSLTRICPKTPRGSKLKQCTTPKLDKECRWSSISGKSTFN